MISIGYAPPSRRRQPIQTRRSRIVIFFRVRVARHVNVLRAEKHISNDHLNRYEQQRIAAGSTSETSRSFGGTKPFEPDQPSNRKANGMEVQMVPAKKRE